MSPESMCREADARSIVTPEIEAIRATFRDFTERFLANMDSMERRMIRAIVCALLGGVLTVAAISLIVLAVAE